MEKNNVKPENVKFIINNKVEVYWNDGYYKSNIEDVQDRYLAISIPIKDGQYIPLRVGEYIEVIYYLGRDIYKFNTTVIGRRTDRVPIILISFPKEVVLVQRRRFVRVPLVCSASCLKIDSNFSAQDMMAVIENKRLFQKATLIDLSGGGMKIKIREEVKPGDTILSYISLNSIEILVKGKIVRVVKDENKRNVCGVSFIDLDERTREKIIKIIFQVMREQMRKA